MAKKAEIRGFYYITHIENLASILRHGIPSHAQIEARNLPFKTIYDTGIVSNRKDKPTPDRASLWEYANLYLQPRNPMMYRVMHEKGRKDLAVVGVKPDILSGDGVWLTDGNAANGPTQFYRVAEGLKVIQNLWSVIQAEYWRPDDGSKRKIMAECLIPEAVAPEHIHSIYVADLDAKNRANEMLGSCKVPVVPEPKMFFHPLFLTRIGKHISLIDGDMFFSNMQTLTVSVNLQGIMGKGLASRAKYQFPDVYVVYQDACRAKQLTATKPFLYKREASLDEDLADLSAPLDTPNAVKWFLLFATKRKWRDNSRVEDIEGGLQWFRDHFAAEGVRSIAMPALGCGLGGLEWSQVGPIMCRYLHDLGIPVAIYLPRERGIDPHYLKATYLLGDKEKT
jgi:O-acetyl-ADP-ribose deacetylase (regulator of RNase III)